ncbi:fibronectin type III domain-containing protein [bacterium]|nr:fibronectin type III domain-containing protein [bacterium]MBT6754189.1 fibronectin type III domain-containing protein [bacterium]
MNKHVKLLSLVFFSFLLILFFTESQAVASLLSPTASWDAPTSGDPIDGYVLNYGTTQGGPYTVEIDVGNVISYTLPLVLTPSTHWYFVVYAYNADGNGPNSSEVHWSTFVTPPVTVNVVGNGTIEDLGTVNVGDDISIAYTPDTGYYVSRVEVNGIEVSNPSSPLQLTNVQLETTVEITFSPYVFILNASVSGTGGSISPNISAVSYGNDVTYDVIADSGRNLSSLIDNSISVINQVANNQYTVSDIGANHTIVAEFELSELIFVPGFGFDTDTPVVGDWDGDGIDNVGVARKGSTYMEWYLDYNGNGQWDGTQIDKVYSFGLATDTPVVGDWDGDGADNVGVARKGSAYMEWYLDYNGNGQWDGSSTELVFVPGFGLATDTPVVGDWDGDGADNVGVARKGSAYMEWYLDYNGDGSMQ